MKDFFVTVNRSDHDWPGWTKRTPVTELAVGVHSLPEAAWQKIVDRVGQARIDAALARGDLVLVEVSL